MAKNRPHRAHFRPPQVGAVIVSGSLLLSGCGGFGGMGSDQAAGISGKTADAVQIAAANPPALGPGDRFAFDNPDVVWEVVSVDTDGRIAWRSDTGETQITDANPLLPALEWHSPTRGNGTRLISGMSASMFPMKPGKEIQFRSTVDTDQPPYAWEFDWQCSIGALSLQTVPAGSFPAYRVACGRQDPEEMVFQYAPQVGNYVRLTVTDPAGKTIERRLTALHKGAGMDNLQQVSEAPQSGLATMAETPMATGGDSQPTMPINGNAAMPSETKSGPTALGMLAEPPVDNLPMGEDPLAPEGAAAATSPTSTGAPGTSAVTTPQTEPARDMSATASAAVPDATSGSVAMHLASYKDPNNAEVGWKQLLAGNRDQLDGLRPIVRKVDIPGKGIFYRLHAGPIASKAQADAMCRTLKARGLYCKVETL
ncbi:hypothetical protein HH303_06685 [Rhodospirillaceae bacterium KN72]|uniref:SPOR domain-containing protein n=1 Tax=Pacificispira spongiicola TaxID=2729598 RepID=A0A7Y0DYX6_9PROT|nr:SPOR domain-containing protein [Pacificispira spongiicola]NMM44155.1 hypothetical protein [Pacificispira spongiicola]